MIPGYWFLGVLTLGLLTLRRRRCAALAVVGCSLLALQSTWVGMRHGWQWTSVAELVWLVQPVASLFLFGDSLVLVTRQRDRALAEQDRAQRERLSTETMAATRREAARMLHDHVLHALHALSRTGQGQSSARPCRMSPATPMPTRPGWSSRRWTWGCGWWWPTTAAVSTPRRSPPTGWGFWAPSGAGWPMPAARPSCTPAPARAPVWCSPGRTPDRRTPAGRGPSRPTT